MIRAAVHVHLNFHLLPAKPGFTACRVTVLCMSVCVKIAPKIPTSQNPYFDCSHPRILLLIVSSSFFYVLPILFSHHFTIGTNSPSFPLFKAPHSLFLSSSSLFLFLRCPLSNLSLPFFPSSFLSDLHLPSSCLSIPFSFYPASSWPFPLPSFLSLQLPATFFSFFFLCFPAFLLSSISLFFAILPHLGLFLYPLSSPYDFLTPSFPLPFLFPLLSTFPCLPILSISLFSLSSLFLPSFYTLFPLHMTSAHLFSFPLLWFLSL